MKSINENTYNRKRISFILLCFALIIMQTANAATERSLYQIKGYGKFPLATSVGQKLYVAYTKDSVGYISGLSVSPGQEVFLHVEVPPGVKLSKKALIHVNAYDEVSTSIFKADGPNQSATIPNNFVYDNYNNEPSSAAGNVEYYSGGSIGKDGAATFGTLAIKNNRATTLRFYTFQTIYYIGSEPEDLANYNAWVSSKEGEVGTSPPVTTSVSAPVIADTPTVSENTGFGDGGGDTVTVTYTASSITNTADCPLAFLGVPCVTAVEPQQEEEPADNGPFEGQVFTEGRYSVLEYLMNLASKNANGGKFEGLTAEGNEFSIVLGGGLTFKFTVDLEQVSEVIDNIDEESVVFSLKPVKGMLERTTYILQYEMMNGVKNEIELHSTAHEGDKLIELIEQFDGVFHAAAKNSWLYVFMDGGQYWALYLDHRHQTVPVPRSDALVFETPVDHGYESNDVNGDGVEDIIVIHNGIAQLMLIKP